MSVVLDYSYYAECSEEELVSRLERLGDAATALGASVEPIVRLEPVYNFPVKNLISSSGCPVPDAVRQRMAEREGADLRDSFHHCYFSLMVPDIPDELALRHAQPALELAKSNELWNPDDYPETIEDGYAFTVTRTGLLREFANIMLGRGYVLLIDPGEGSEPVCIAVSSYRSDRTPVWAGDGFTKTQYARQFVQTHDRACRILDAARDCGLLYEASDVCGYFEHRDWTKAADIVNAETIGAANVSALLDVAADHLKDAGVDIKCLESPASETVNIVRVKRSKENPTGDDK